MNKCFLLLAVISLTACSTFSKHGDLLELRARASNAYNQGDYSQAQKLYENLVGQAPEDADLRFRLGNAYARGQQSDKAILSYQAAVIRNPRLHKAWNNMGTIQLRASANSFTQLLQNLNPNDPMYDEGLDLVNKVLGVLKAKPLSFPASNADSLPESASR